MDGAHGARGIWRFGGGRVRSCIRPVVAAHIGCWPWC